MGSPVSASSSARLPPTARATATIGVWQNQPPLPPGVAKLASSAATARSQEATSWQPAAVATPCTRATTGCGRRWSVSMSSVQVASRRRMPSPYSGIPPPRFCYPRPPMILTRDVILAEIAKERLAIEPLAPEQVGPASIDLHLGDEIRVFDDGTDAIEVTEDADYRAVTRVRRLDDAYVLKPGETIHAITRERLHLPPGIGGWLEGRSRFARLGLMIHVTSGFEI